MSSDASNQRAQSVSNQVSVVGNKSQPRSSFLGQAENAVDRSKAIIVSSTAVKKLVGPFPSGVIVLGREAQVNKERINHSEYVNPFSHRRRRVQREVVAR